MVYVLLGIILHQLGILKGWILFIYILGCLSYLYDFIERNKGK